MLLPEKVVSYAEEVRIELTRQLYPPVFETEPVASLRVVLPVLAVLPGIGPGFQVSETCVLPLHYRTIIRYIRTVNLAGYTVKMLPDEVDTDCHPIDLALRVTWTRTKVSGFKGRRAIHYTITDFFKLFELVLGEGLEPSLTSNPEFEVINLVVLPITLPEHYFGAQ